LLRHRDHHQGRWGLSLLDEPARVDALNVLSEFRTGFHGCLTARADALFELADALLCTDGPVKTLVDLALAPEHRRGHGALYDGLNSGRLDVARFRRTLSALPLPRAAGGRIVLAVDVSPWLRSDAATSADRLFCHVHGRAKNSSQFIPGWPYSFVAALESGRTSWTAVLDAVRLGPEDDATAVTAAQLRDVIERLLAAGQWKRGDDEILIVCDAGYDVTRLAFLLTGLPVELVGRIRSDRVLRLPAPPRLPGTNGRPPKHDGDFALSDDKTWPEPQITTTTQTTRYGIAVATSWDRVHPRLTHRAAWLDHDGPLPILEGTVIRLRVDRLPGSGEPKPMWLWSSRTGAAAADVDRSWQAFLRRFDLEHMFRLFKQTLGWTAPKIRTPEAGDRWTWLVIAAPPSSVSPAISPRISAVPGNGPPADRAGSPLHGCAAGFGTSARRSPSPPVHRNPANQAPDDRPAPRTAGPHPTTTWGKRSKERPPSPPGSGRQVKRKG
jgi:DDE superfamily endonuclease